MTRIFSLIFFCLFALGANGVLTADEKDGPGPGAGKEGFAKLKKLVGTWVAADESGKPTDQVVSIFKVTGGGTAIHETIFPGKGHEMMTIYHMDGKDLVLTHYCAAGNQPKMKFDPKSPIGQLSFLFAGGTNFDPAKDAHMHEGRIVLVDEDHIEWTWMGHNKGQPDNDHNVSMKLVRKKP